MVEYRLHLGEPVVVLWRDTDRSPTDRCPFCNDVHTPGQNDGWYTRQCECRLDMMVDADDGTAVPWIDGVVVLSRTHRNVDVEDFVRARLLLNRHNHHEKCWTDGMTMWKEYVRWCMAHGRMVLTKDEYVDAMRIAGAMDADRHPRKLGVGARLLMDLPTTVDVEYEVVDGTAYLVLYRNTDISTTDPCPFCGECHDHGFGDGFRSSHCRPMELGRGSSPIQPLWTVTALDGTTVHHREQYMLKTRFQLNDLLPGILHGLADIGYPASATRIWVALQTRTNAKLDAMLYSLRVIAGMETLTKDKMKSILESLAELKCTAGGLSIKRIKGGTWHVA
jgi:hypothetical protein